MIEVLKNKIDNQDILKSARYVYSKHKILRENMSFSDTIKFFDMFPNRLVIQKEDGRIRGVAMFMKLTDDSLISILRGEIDLYEDGMMGKLMSEDGEHIYFIGVVADGMKFILKGLRDIRKAYNPITISWVKDFKTEKPFIVTLRS